MTEYGTLLHAREVLRLQQQEGAQVAEVLPRSSYDLWHLPGAVSLPLREIDERAEGELDRERPVIVYCNDAL